MASEHIVELTDENWKTEVLESNVPVLVDFWAPWCGPCRAIGPTIDKIASQFVGKVKVGKLNVDDAPDAATRYGVTTIPRVFLFEKGQHRQLFNLSEAELVRSINSSLPAK